MRGRIAYAPLAVLRASRILTIGLAAPVFATSLASTGAASSYAAGYGPCTITVAVRDRSGRPVAGAVVTATGPTTRTVTTAPSGIASFNAVPSGRYAIAARTSNERSTIQSASVTTAAGSTPASRALQFVALQVQPETTSGGSIEPRVVETVPLALAEAAPAFSLAGGPHVDVSGLGTSGGIRVDGGDARGLRERLDGVPLPDALRGALVLVGTPALGDYLALAGGTGTLGARPSPGTGGVLDLETQPLGRTPDADFAIGSSERGLVTSLAADETAGAFSAGLRVGSSPDDTVAREIDGRIRLSTATDLTGRAYRLDDANGLAAGPFAVAVRSAGLTTSLGAARVSARLYDSAFALDGVATDDRLNGYTLGYEGTLGPSGVDVSYARDREFAHYGDGTSAGSVESRLGLHDTYELTPAVRADVQYAYGHGTSIGVRNDLATTLGFTLAPTLVLKLAASSGVTPAPLDLLSRGAIASLATPETAFEDSVSLEDRSGVRTTRFEAFERRETNRFAESPDARSTGLSAAYASAPAAGFGFSLSGAFANVALSGTATPQRDAETTGLARVLGIATASDAIAALRSHASLDFRSAGGVSASLGATYLDAPNALAPTALVLGDLGVRVPLTRGAGPLALRVSAHDAVGESRRDLELTLERTTAP